MKAPTESADELLKRALQLPEGERVRVASALLASVECDLETRDSDAWIAEVERRARVALSGVAGLTWDETRSRIERVLGS